MSVDTTPQYHSAFQGICSPHTDFILESSDSTLYRLPNFVLSSEAFLPSPSTIPIDAPSKVVTPLLQLLSGLPVQPFKDFETYSQTVLLARSWRAPLGSLRAAATSPQFLSDPLAVYALACRCGWEEEAAIAARRTLSVDLYDPSHARILESMPTPGLIQLFKYHRARREMFGEKMGDGFSERCHSCGAKAGGGEWRALKARMVLEVEKGHENVICSLEMEEWYESEGCWGVKCKECGGRVYDKLETLKRIREAVKALPELGF